MVKKKAKKKVKKKKFDIEKEISNVDNKMTKIIKRSEDCLKDAGWQ